MSYYISEEKIISVNTASGVASVDATIIASSKADLPAYNAIPGRILVPGSAALVPEEPGFYMLATDNTWKWGGVIANEY